MANRNTQRHTEATRRYEAYAEAYRKADAEAHEAWQIAHEEGTVDAVEEAYRLQAIANELASKAISAHRHMQDMHDDIEAEVAEAETETKTSNPIEEETEMRKETVIETVMETVAMMPRMKMNLQFFAEHVGARANRVVVRNEADGFVAEFFKTHKHIAEVFSEDTSWSRNPQHSQTQAREDFRTWVQANASEFGVDWSPEYEAQSWNRKYWKYETDAQVEEDAIELMGWTIKQICEKCKMSVDISDITLDSIVPMPSNLSYVENGKYTKNGNWAVAQVNLEVKAEIEGTEIDIIYPIEMRSGQLTKIKLTKDEINDMIKDSKTA